MKPRDAELDVVARLAGALLAFLLGSVQPPAQDGEWLAFDFEKGDAAAEIGLDVNDFGFGVEEIFAGENLDEDQGLLGEGIHHVQVAAVQAQFADTSSDTHVGFLFDELRAGDESVAWRSALFSLQGDRPPKSYSHEMTLV